MPFGGHDLSPTFSPMQLGEMFQQSIDAWVDVIHSTPTKHLECRDQHFRGAHFVLWIDSQRITSQFFNLRKGGGYMASQASC